MTEYEQFKTWLSEKLLDEQKFPTLKGRSNFWARYDVHDQSLNIRRSTNKEGRLRDDQILRIFERYEGGSPSERKMTSFYTDPWWPDTPNLILAPYVAALVKTWREEKMLRRGHMP